MSKFHSKKTVVDGIKFDSKLEAKHYKELKERERAGEIRDLILQPEFELTPSFKKNGKTYRKTSYKADFSYFDIGMDKYIIEDVKGFRTDVYKLKRKLFEYRYTALEIVEITK